LAIKQEEELVTVSSVPLSSESKYHLNALLNYDEVYVPGQSDPKASGTNFHLSDY
jgi:hypothetical protein